MSETSSIGLPAVDSTSVSLGEMRAMMVSSQHGVERLEHAIERTNTVVERLANAVSNIQGQQGRVPWMWLVTSVAGMVAAISVIASGFLSPMQAQINANKTETALLDSFVNKQLDALTANGSPAIRDRLTIVEINAKNAADNLAKFEDLVTKYDEREEARLDRLEHNTKP